MFLFQKFQLWDLGFYLFDVSTEIQALVCGYAEVHIEDSYWYQQDAPADHKIDDFPRDSIVSFCYWFQGAIHNSQFHNQWIYLFASGWFELHVTNSALLGSDPPGLLAGSLALFLTNNFEVTITNTTFKDLKFSDFVLGGLYHQLGEMAGALSFYVGLEVRDELDDIQYIRIENCTFHGNFRAINFWSQADTSDITFEIINTVFQCNEVHHNGGAISAVGSFAPIKINFTNCSFFHNKAGVRPFHTPITHLNKIVTNFQNLTILDYKIQNKRTTLTVLSTHHNVARTRTKQLGTSGSGGAIYFYLVHSVIRNCTFIGNSANDKGGSVFFSLEVVAVLENTRFETDSNPSRTTEGVILASYAQSLTANGLVMIVTMSIGNDSSIFDHQSTDTGKCWLNNVTAVCPVNSRLQVASSSDSLFEFTDSGNLKYARFKELHYVCSPCSEGSYMFQGGSYSLQQWNGSFLEQHGSHEITSDFAHTIDHPPLHCHTCP